MPCTPTCESMHELVCAVLHVLLHILLHIHDHDMISILSCSFHCKGFHSSCIVLCAWHCTCTYKLMYRTVDLEPSGGQRSSRQSQSNQNWAQLRILGLISKNIPGEHPWTPLKGRPRPPPPPTNTSGSRHWAVPLPFAL